MYGFWDVCQFISCYDWPFSLPDTGHVPAPASGRLPAKPSKFLGVNYSTAAYNFTSPSKKVKGMVKLPPQICWLRMAFFVWQGIILPQMYTAAAANIFNLGINYILIFSLDLGVM